MMKKNSKKEKNKKLGDRGITLIALIVTIIVLLILAGVSIAVLTGENGILNRATEAKQTNEQKTAEEELKLGIVSLSTDYYSKTTRPSTFREFIFTEESEADLNKYLSETATFDDTNYTITYKNILYEVEENGTISKSEGIILDKTNIDNLQIVTNGTNVTYGETTINATTVNLTGNITWSVKNNSSVVLLTPSADGKTVTIKANQAGSATIVASCSGKTKECSVTVTSVTAVTSITLDKSSGTVNAGDNFVITATTNGTENLTWNWEKTSGNTSLTITTSGTGKTMGTIVGSGAGTAVVTVSAPNATAQTCTITVQEVGYFKTIVTNQETGDGIAYYYTGENPQPGTSTTTEITASNMGQFLGMKVNYTPGGYLTIGSTTVGQGANYRVFYIDVAGKYGNAGTIYLKAEEDSNYAALSSITDPQVSDIATNFNKEWTGSTYASSPAENMTYVNKLLNKNIWSVYKDTAGIANYVVGAPDLEMWVDGYNKFLSKNSPTNGTYYAHNYTVSASTTGVGTNNGKGYYIGINNAYGNNDGYSTATSTMVNSSSYASGSVAADRVKAWNNGGYYWLASPSAEDSNNVMIVYGSVSIVCDYGYDSSLAFCPLVSCNSGVAISEKAE